MAEEITNPSEELISPTEETASPSDEMTGDGSVATETKPSVSKVDMLWNALSKDDVYKSKVGSIDEFRTKMQNPEKAKMLWNALSKDEVYASKVGDEKTFLSKVSSPKSPAPSTKGGESGAVKTPSASTSVLEDLESGSWTKTISPNKQEQPVSKPVIEVPKSVKQVEEVKPITSKDFQIKQGAVPDFTTERVDRSEKGFNKSLFDNYNSSFENYKSISDAASFHKKNIIQKSKSSKGVLDGFEEFISPQKAKIAEEYRRKELESQLSSDPLMQKFNSESKKAKSRFDYYTKSATEEIDKQLDAIANKNGGWGKFVKPLGEADVDKVRNAVDDFLVNNDINPDSPIAYKMRNEMKAKAEFKKIEPQVNTEFEINYKKKYGVTPDEDLQKEYGLKANEITGIKQAKDELEKRRALESQSLKAEFQPQINAYDEEYKTKLNALNLKVESDPELNNYANSLYKENFSKYQSLVNQGAITVEQANQEMNSPQNLESINAKIIEKANEKYGKDFEAELTTYQKQLNELNSRYNSIYRRQESARLEQANKKIESELNKFKGSFKPSKEILERREKAYSDACNIVGGKYSKAQENVTRELGHLRQTQALLSGLGGGLKSYGQYFDNKFLYDMGESIEANNLLKIPESKNFSDWLDADKLVVGTGNIIGRMIPMIGVSAATGFITRNWSATAQMATIGLTGWVTEGADMAGAIKGEVLEQTGDPVKADEAVKSMWQSHVYSMPLYAFSGLPFVNGLPTKIAKRIAPSLFKEVAKGTRRTFGQYLKQTAAAAAVSSIGETAEEIPQEFKQGIDEEAIRNGAEIRNISDQLRILKEGASWKRFGETVVQVAPSTFVMGSTPVFLSESTKYAKEKYYERSVDNYINGLSISEALETSPEQYIYNTLRDKGKNFTSTLINTLYTSGNIDEQTYDKLADKLQGMDNFQNFLVKNKLEFTKTENIIGYKLHEQYQQAKKDLEDSTDELGKDILKDRARKAKDDFESFYKGEGVNAVVLTMGDGKQFVFSPEEMNFALQFENIRNDIRNKNISVAVLSKLGKESDMQSVVDEMEKIQQEKPLEEELTTAEGEVVLTKNTSPTSEKYGTINRNDGKGVVDLTKEEYEAEQAKMQPKVDEQVTPTAEVEQAPKTKEEIVAEIERLKKEKEDEIREVKRTRGLIAQQTLIPEIEAKYNTQITKLEKQYEKEPTKKEDGKPLSGGVQGLRIEGQERKESAELRPEEEVALDIRNAKDIGDIQINDINSGNVVIGYHATPTGEIGTGKELGIHIGTEDVSNNIKKGRNSNKGDVKKVAFRVNKPLILGDMPSWSSVNVLNEMIRLKLLGIDKEKLREIRDSDLSEKDKQQRIIELAKEKGYDSFAYQNFDEGNGEFSYVLFDDSKLNDITPKEAKSTPQAGSVNEFQYVIDKARKSGESEKGSGTKKVNLSDKEAAILNKTIEKLEAKAVENNGASFDENETINVNYEKVNGKEQKINTYNIDGYEIKYKHSRKSFTEIRTPQGDLIIIQKQYGKTEVAYLGNNKSTPQAGSVVGGEVETFELIENEGEWKATTKAYKGREVGNWVYNFLDKKQKSEYNKIRDKANSYGTKEDAEKALKLLQEFENNNKDAFEKAKKAIDYLKQEEERKEKQRDENRKIVDKTSQEIDTLSDSNFEVLIGLLDEERRKTLEQRFGDRIDRRELFRTPISESYHADKTAGKETELTRAVEQLLGKPKEATPQVGLVLAQFGDNINEGVTTLEKAIKGQLSMESGGIDKPFGVNIWTNEKGEIKYVGNDASRSKGLTQNIFAFDKDGKLLIEESVIKSKEAQQAVEQSLQSTPQAEEKVSGGLTQEEKTNLEAVAKEAGVNFQEVRNVYNKYGDGKPLNEITLEDYQKAEEKRQGGKEKEAVEEKPENKKGKYNQKFADSKKVYGEETTIEMANGETRDAIFVVVELDDILASHDEVSFNDTEGFPKTKAGRNVNSRNYKNDKTAQLKVNVDAKGLKPSIVISDAATTDTGVPVISKEGIVISGNGRTMAIKLSKKIAPEKYQSYKKDLIKRAFKYGLDSNEVAKMKNPIMVKLDRSINDYSVKLFDDYNGRFQKEESPIDEAIKRSTIIQDNPSLKDSILSVISRHETMSDLFNNREDRKELLKIFLDNDVILSQEVVKYVSEDGSFTDDGKGIVNDILIATVLSPETLAATESVKAFRNKIINALPVLTANYALGENSLENELNEAVLLQAKIASMGNQSDFWKHLNQIGMFDVVNPDLVILNRIIESGRDKFKKFIMLYNNSMSVGDMNLFGGEGVMTKKEVIDQLKKTILDENERQIIGNLEELYQDFEQRRQEGAAKVDEGVPQQKPTDEEVETPKQEEDAVQKQAAGQVPIQPKAGVGEEVEGGKPKTKSEKATKESQKEIDNLFDLYDSIDESKGLDKRKAADDFRNMQQSIKNPTLKRIFDNISDIHSQLEKQGLITKTKGCP